MKKSLILVCILLVGVLMSDVSATPCGIYNPSLPSCPSTICCECGKKCCCNGWDVTYTNDDNCNGASFCGGPPACTFSCLLPQDVQCGGSLVNGCAPGCSTSGGTKCLSGMTCVSGSCKFFNNNLDNGLISYWPFDSATGSNSTFAKDVVGGNNGVVLGSISQVSSGVVREAYKFPGLADSYINTSMIMPTGSLAWPNYTIAFWAKIEDPSVAQSFVVQAPPSGVTERLGDGGVFLHLNQINSHRFNGVSLTSDVAKTPRGMLAPNRWAYVVAVWQQGSNCSGRGTARIYVDGEEKIVETACALYNLGNWNYFNNVVFGADRSGQSYFLNGTPRNSK